MITIVASIILIFEFLIIFFLILGADVQLVGNLLLWTIFPVALLIFFTWKRGFDYAKGILYVRLNGNNFFKDIADPFIHPKKFYKNTETILPGDPKLNDVFISNQELNERQFGSFLRMLLNLWGFATFLVSTTFEIGKLVGVDKFTNNSDMSSLDPYGLSLFVQFARFAGILYGVWYVIPSKLLSTINLRRVIRQQDRVNSIPSYDWKSYGSVFWILSFGTLFFHDVFKSSNEQISIYVQQFAFYFIMVGLPLLIYCLIYVGYFEPKIKNQLLTWATKELEIKQSSVSLS